MTLKPIVPALIALSSERGASALLAVGALLLGCSTTDSSRSSHDSGAQNPPPPTLSISLAGDNGAPLRRLSRTEYANTVRDVLGNVSIPIDQLPADAVATTGYPYSATLSVRDAQAYADAAKSIAAQIEERLGTLIACNGVADDVCAQSFIKDIGRRVYRRPLDDSDTSALLTVYTEARASGRDLAAGLQLVLAAMLASPQFLYIDDLDIAPLGDGTVLLSSHSLASRLSFALWQTSPDAQLRDTAESGAIYSPAVRKSEAVRLLADQRARSAVAEFHAWWLGYYNLGLAQKDATAYPSFDASLRESMQRSVDAFVSWAVLEDGSFSTLLSSPTAFVDSGLAKFYGVTAVAEGEGLVSVNIPNEVHVGVLSEPAVMSITGTPSEGSPVRRGKLIRERFFCQDVPAPPPNVNMKLPDPQPGQSIRGRFQAHSMDATCAACHSLIDPIGFGFSAYDAIGHYDPALATDAFGEVTGTDVDGAFASVPELASKLASSETVQACYVREWFRFMFRRLENPADEPTLQAATAAFRASNLDIREMVLSLIASEAFAVRVRPQEVTQ